MAARLSDYVWNDSFTPVVGIPSHVAPRPARLALPGHWSVASEAQGALSQPFIAIVPP
jgi:hypothetical protein